MKKLFACVVAAVMATAAVPSQAETPRDALVMAWTFDDIISLDPAEIFEFSAAEYAGNTYDRLIAYDVDNVSDIYGEAVESWTISDDGKTFTFKMRPGIKFASGNPMWPVRRGEITCRGLGMAVAVFDDDGREVVGEPGERRVVSN